MEKPKSAENLDEDLKKTNKDKDMEIMAKDEQAKDIEKQKDTEKKENTDIENNLKKEHDKTKMEHKIDVNEKKNEKEIKESVTFGKDTVEIIEGKEQEDSDSAMAIDLSLDKDTSTEQEASIESLKSTDNSSQQSPFEVDTYTHTEDYEDDDYEIPCSQIKRSSRVCHDLFKLGHLDDDNGSETGDTAET